MKRLAFAAAAGLVAVTGVLYAVRRPAPRAAVSAPRPPRPPAAPAAPPLAALPPPASVAADPPPARMHGTVVHALTGEPLAGVRVELCRDHVGGPDPCVGVIESTETGEDGTFALGPEPEEDVDDQDAGERGAPEPDADPDADAPVPGALVARAEGYGPVIVVKPELDRAAQQGLLVALGPGARLSGRVLLRSGEPPESAEVVWTLPGKRASETVDVGATGEYELEDLPAGEVVVAARVLDEVGRAGAARVRLAAGESRRLDLVLDTPTYVVRGRLLDADGHPVRNASVAEESHARSDVECVLALARDGEHTDPDGSFELEFATRGPHRIRFTLESSEEPTLVEVSLLAHASALDEPAPEQVVRVTRPDLVRCAFFRPDGKPAGVLGRLIETASGGIFSSASCGGSGYYQGPNTYHLLWPPEGGPVHVQLDGPDGKAEVTLHSPAQRCDLTAQPWPEAPSEPQVDPPQDPDIGAEADPPSGP